MQALRQGILYQVARSADNPYCQLNTKQVRSIIGRMAKEGITRRRWAIGAASVSRGGSRTSTIPRHCWMFAIAKEDNGHGYAADRDIALFSAFIHMFNLSAWLYAISEKVQVEGQPW